MSDDEDRGPDLAAGIDVDALPDGALVAGTFAGDDVVLVNDRGRLCAWSGKCTHLDAPLADGLLIDGQLRCPWHHARFSTETGEAIAAPAFAPLARYDVERRDGRVFVTAKSDAVVARERPTASPGRVVIVGGGAGGFACAEMLARDGFGAHVTLVSDDADPPYDRTLCSKQYLIGLVSRDDGRLAFDANVAGPLPALRMRRRATAIDAKARHVVLDDGETLGYDALVLATGARPKCPDAPGFDGPDVHVLRTLADADALIATATPGRRAVVVGASFIGLETAASLTQRHVAVDVVAPDDIPLEKIVGADVGAMIRAVHEEKGVRFHLGREAKRYDGRVVTLDDGTTIEADFVVLGVGVEPRTELAEAAGLDVAPRDDGGGVLVDAQLRTSDRAIFAIGDIARYPESDSGARILVEHWVHAQRQGQFVARLLTGRATRFEDLPFFWSAHFDTGLLYLGHVGRIVRTEVDGAVDARAFTMRIVGENDERAFLSCDRDRPALAVEAAWEREHREAPDPAR